MEVKRSLREISTSEKILGCPSPSLLKLGENYWLQEEAENAYEDSDVDALVQDLELHLFTFKSKK